MKKKWKNLYWSLRSQDGAEKYSGTISPEWDENNCIFGLCFPHRLVIDFCWSGCCRTVMFLDELFCTEWTDCTEWTEAFWGITGWFFKRKNAFLGKTADSVIIFLPVNSVQNIRSETDTLYMSFATAQSNSPCREQCCFFNRDPEILSGDILNLFSGMFSFSSAQNERWGCSSGNRQSQMIADRQQPDACDKGHDDQKFPEKMQAAETVQKTI